MRWHITLIDYSTGKELLDWQNVEKSFKTIKFPFKEGQEFYIKIIAQDEYHAPTNVIYKLKVTTTARNNWENEYNDSVDNPSKLTPNKPMNGNLYNAGDINCFQYTVHENGYQVFSLAPSNTTSDFEYGWNMSIFDVNTKETI